MIYSAKKNNNLLHKLILLHWSLHNQSFSSSLANHPFTQSIRYNSVNPLIPPSQPSNYQRNDKAIRWLALKTLSANFRSDFTLDSAEWRDTSAAAQPPLAGSFMAAVDTAALEKDPFRLARLIAPLLPRTYLSSQLPRELRGENRLATINPR